LGFRGDDAACLVPLEENRIEVGTKGPVGGVIGISRRIYPGYTNIRGKVGIIEYEILASLKSGSQGLSHFLPYLRHKEWIPITLNFKVVFAVQIEFRMKPVRFSQMMNGCGRSQDLQGGGGRIWLRMILLAKNPAIRGGDQKGVLG
jgi:hypothetical protein